MSGHKRVKGLHVVEKRSTGECILESYINKTFPDRRTEEIDVVYCVYYLPLVSPVAFCSQNQDESY